MNWFLPITLVLVVALIVAAIHFVFMRWMEGQPEPVRESDAPLSSEAERERFNDTVSPQRRAPRRQSQ